MNQKSLIPKMHFYVPQNENSPPPFGYLNIHQSGLALLLKKGILQEYKVNNRSCVDLNKVLKHVEWEKKFVDEHYTDMEVWDLLGHTGSKSVRKRMFPNLKAVCDQGFIDMVNLDFHLVTMQTNKNYWLITRFFTKKSVKKFLAEYVNYYDAAKIQGIKPTKNAGDFWNEKGFTKVRFSSKYEMTFYNKKQIEDYVAKRNFTAEEKLEYALVESDYLNATQVKSLLNFRNASYKIALDKELIKIEKREKNGQLCYFEKEKILRLKRTQEHLLRVLPKKWYTAEEVIELGFDPSWKHYLTEFKRINVPHLISNCSKYKGKKILFLKKDIDAQVQKLLFNDNYYMDVGTVWDNINHRLTLKEIKFPEHCNETGELWFIFLKERSSNWSPNTFDGKAGLISACVMATEMIALNLEKEIYEYSSDALNMMFFNELQPFNGRAILYSFLKNIDESLKFQNKRTFNFSKINSPYNVDANNNKPKEIYSPAEYKEFFKFISNISIHKQKAIQSINNICKNSSNNLDIPYDYDNYDSLWLYFVLHLTNAWRGPDFVSFPSQPEKITFDSKDRADFTGTSIEPTLEWLEQNDISKADAEILYRRFAIKEFRFSKTDKERYLNIPEDLLLAFANAVTLCEVRTRHLSPLSESLITFYNKKNTVSQRMLNIFFEGFKLSIQFESLKMQRTVVNLIERTSKQFAGIAHDLEILKYVRNHSHIDVTNIYFILSQEEVNFLSRQLFSRNDFFGYISDTFSDMLFGQTGDLQLKTEQNNFLIERLGDTFNLERIAGFINHAIKNQNLVTEIIKEMDLTKVEEKYKQLVTLQLSSKEEHISCLVGVKNCPYSEKICGRCHFAIYNFYSISKLCRNIMHHIEFILNEFQDLNHDAEREKALFLFFTDLVTFNQALNKYGEVIFEFMDFDLEKWEILLGSLPEYWQQFVANKEELIEQITI